MIKLGSLRVESIGHLILNTIRFFSERKNHSRLIIVSNPKKIVNRFVYNFLKKNYQNQNVHFYENEIIYFLIIIFSKIQRRIKFLSHFYANIRWIHHEFPRQEYGSDYRFYDSFLENKIKFSFEEKNQRIFNIWKKKNNIKSKFICIFGRDNSYHDEVNPNPRNFNFLSYKKLINWLIKSNYTVVRMGRKHNEKFFLNDKNYIDFADITKRKKKKNLELIEFMLFKNCEFIVGSTSGIHAYALLFDKKFFYVNNFPAGRNPYFKNCIFINKKYKKKDKIIPYNKISKNILLSENYNDLKKKKITIINNSENEIFELVKKNINKFKGQDISNHKFIVEGSGALCCYRWYKKNLKLFKN